MPIFANSGKKLHFWFDFLPLTKNTERNQNKLEKVKIETAHLSGEKTLPGDRRISPKKFYLEDRKLGTGAHFVILKVCGISESFWGLPFVGCKNFGETKSW